MHYAGKYGDGKNKFRAIVVVGLHLSFGDPEGTFYIPRPLVHNFHEMIQSRRPAGLNSAHIDEKFETLVGSVSAWLASQTLPLPLSKRGIYQYHLLSKKDAACRAWCGNRKGPDTCTGEATFKTPAVANPTSIFNARANKLGAAWSDYTMKHNAISKIRYSGHPEVKQDLVTQYFKIGTESEAWCTEAKVHIAARRALADAGIATGKFRGHSEAFAHFQNEDPKKLKRVTGDAQREALKDLGWTELAKDSSSD